MNIFNAEIISKFFENHYFIFLTMVFLGTSLSTWFIIPKILWVTNEKNLSKPVIDRSLHSKPVSSFGGVAFFITLILTLSMVQALGLSIVGNHLMAAITILFMVGLKDDLVISTAKVKFVGQFLAIMFLIFAPELQITNLHGFLGINEIPEWAGAILAVFLLLGSINSYNLIDGIDGLAAITGIIIGVIYSVVFYFSGNHFYVFVSMCMVGMLMAFLRFNLAKGKNKIFMGDSGSLVIGLIIGFLTLKMLNLNSLGMQMENFIPENRLLFVLAVLFIPIFDTSRAMIIRLIQKKSPFDADTNHTHHVLVNAGCSHLRSALWLGFLNSVVVGIVLFLASIFNSIIMSLVMCLIYLLGCYVFFKLKNMDRSIVVQKFEPDGESIPKI